MPLASAGFMCPQLNVVTPRVCEVCFVITTSFLQVRKLIQIRGVQVVRCASLRLDGLVKMKVAQLCPPLCDIDSCFANRFANCAGGGKDSCFLAFVVQSLSCVELFAVPWTEHARLLCHHLLEFAQTHVH